MNDGGPAFPMPSGPEPRIKETTHYNEGMSLRDYFAAKVAPHLLQSLDGEKMTEVIRQCEMAKVSGPFALAAFRAYEFADAMLAARMKPTESGEKGKEPGDG